MQPLVKLQNDTFWTIVNSILLSSPPMTKSQRPLDYPVSASPEAFDDAGSSSGSVTERSIPLRGSNIHTSQSTASLVG
ncbi:hypothetical protein DM01DRAFT_1186435 [Hesseltinella vesiculosa]|uniref:Uncharacterized protein n=1 Tax=Hesseltinella vesiculosa TaxID=101127 RepID=A0A1X2GQM5_9FUNG|nr:hypothetical protein DM01DRAFT_1186435 [Hesseltinella vesiculosa]